MFGPLLSPRVRLICKRDPFVDPDKRSLLLEAIPGQRKALEGRLLSNGLSALLGRGDDSKRGVCSP